MMKGWFDGWRWTWPRPRDDMGVGTGRYGYGMRKEGREGGGREREGRKAGRKEGVEKRATRETRTKAFQVEIGIPGVCFPCHTIPSVLQPQVVYSYKKIIEKKRKKRKKNQIIVVNSDDITRYYNYAKTIKVSLFSLPLPLPLFLLLGKAKEWNQYVYLGRESGMNMEEENSIIQYFW